MKKIKVSIQDENTLVLLEDATKGDLIDLKSLHETDIDKTTITNVVNSIKRDKFEEELKKATDNVKRDFTHEQERKENEWKQNEQKKLQEKENVINELKNQNNRAEIEKKLAINEAVQKIEKEKDNLVHDLKTKDLEKQNLESSLKEKF